MGMGNEGGRGKMARFILWNSCGAAYRDGR
jgi:hypothetical protein